LIVKHIINISLFALVFLSLNLFAQVEAPNKEYLFEEDYKNIKEKRDKQAEKSTEILKTNSEKTKFESSELSFDRKKSVLETSGNVIINKSGLVLSAEQAGVNIDTQEVELSKGARISLPIGELDTSKANLNLNYETGTFSNAELYLINSGYFVTADQIKKVSEFEYDLENSEFTTCDCPDKDKPWSFKCDKANITQEAYAKTTGTRFKVDGKTVFYFPKLIFPVKQQRSSGLLFPSFGWSTRNGILYKQPMFFNLDHSTDLIFSPFIETKTRKGFGLDYNKVFSLRHKLESRFIYSNESARGDDLKGTVTDGLFDPTFDKNRIGGYLRHNYQAKELPISYVADIHYVSDDLFAREIEDDDIALTSSRYTTSTAALRSAFGNFYAEVGFEYNQSFDQDDDLIFQRAPQAQLSYQKTLRPFGYNPLGLKVKTGVNVNAVNFIRKSGYEGNRLNVSPFVAIPFRYKNYFNGEISYKLDNTNYSYTNTEILDTDTDITLLDDSRSIPEFKATLQTAIEKVYDLKKDKTKLLKLGAENNNQSLVRLKHTVEPIVEYLNVPERDQEGLGFFDSFDRIKERNLISYGVKSELFGKFTNDDIINTDNMDLVPFANQLPVSSIYGDLDYDSRYSPNKNYYGLSVDRGRVRKLLDFNIRQNYNLDTEDQEDKFSDLYFGLGVYPSRYFGAKFTSNYNTEDKEFSSYGVAAHLRDDRGDVIRARYSNIKDRLSQLEAGLEIKLTDKLKTGYYTRYDELDQEFIENRFLLRLISACNCWSIDLGLRETLNPERKDVIVGFNLKGLGGLSQGISYREN